MALNPFLLRPRRMKSLEEAGSLQEKGALFGPREGEREGVIRGPRPRPGRWAAALGTRRVHRCAVDGSASLAAPGLRAAAGRRGGETQAHCPRPRAGHFACNVRIHCLSRNSECPAVGCQEQAPGSTSPVPPLWEGSGPSLGSQLKQRYAPEMLTHRSQATVPGPGTPGDGRKANQSLGGGCLAPGPSGVHLGSQGSPASLLEVREWPGVVGSPLSLMASRLGAHSEAHLLAPPLRASDLGWGQARELLTDSQVMCWPLLRGPHFRRTNLEA